MPKPAHAMITHSGVIGTTGGLVEEWAFTVKCFDGPEGDVGLQAAADAARDLYRDHLAPLLPNYTTLTRTRFSLHAAGQGLVQQDPTTGSYAQADQDEFIAGGRTTSNYFPLQTALCISLDTDRPGPRGRGRFFLPMPAMPLAADFRLSTAQQGEVADAAQDYLSGLRAFGSGAAIDNLDPCVVSSFGFASAVTSVRVGRVPDTMRSRRGDLEEAYVSRPVPRT